MKPIPPFKVTNGHIRVGVGEDATTWPWPFRDDDCDSAAWKARYAPHRLTRVDLFELAGIADAYEALITHVSQGVRDRLRVLHRIYDRTCRHWVLDTDACAECIEIRERRAADLNLFEREAIEELSAAACDGTDDCPHALGHKTIGRLLAQGAP